MPSEIPNRQFLESDDLPLVRQIWWIPFFGVKQFVDIACHAACLFVAEATRSGRVHVHGKYNPWNVNIYAVQPVIVVERRHCR